MMPLDDAGMGSQPAAAVLLLVRINFKKGGDEMWDAGMGMKFWGSRDDVTVENGSQGS